MFSNISRYRKLPDDVTLDVQGRQLPSKSLRPLPDVAGTFRHTIADGDRLDQLAAQYYGQPRKWWRVCDANPEFLSPLALLGNEPLVTCRFTLAPKGASGSLAWANMLSRVAATAGVEDIQLDGDETGVVVTFNQITLAKAALAKAIGDVGAVTFNQIALAEATLADAIGGDDFEVGQAQPIGRVGKQIIIPPDTFG